MDADASLDEAFFQFFEKLASEQKPLPPEFQLNDEQYLDLLKKTNEDLNGY